MGLFVLYGLAALWALNVLLKLMQQHKQRFERQLQQEQARLQAEEAVFEAIEKKQQELHRQPPHSPASRAA